MIFRQILHPADHNTTRIEKSINISQENLILKTNSPVKIRDIHKIRHVHLLLIGEEVKRHNFLSKN